MSLLRLRPAGVRGRLAGEAPFPRPDHGGAPALEADFTVDRRDAVADRAVGEAKLLGDLLVGEASGDPAEDLPFAGSPGATKPGLSRSGAVRSSSPANAPLDRCGWRRLASFSMTVRLNQD